MTEMTEISWDVRGLYWAVLRLGFYLEAKEPKPNCYTFNSGGMELIYELKPISEPKVKCRMKVKV
jgi:hypothetical protein